MTVVIDVKCSPCSDGYRFLRFDHASLFPTVDPKNPFGEKIPAEREATDDENYLLQHWGAKISVVPRKGIEHYLTPKSKKMRTPFSILESEPNLFLRFANTPTTREAVNEFADQYGLLRNFGPEPFEHWQHAINDMKKAVGTLVNAGGEGNLHKVSQFINGRIPFRLPLGKDKGISANISLKTDSSGRPQLCIRATDLTEALWLQLAQAVDGNHSVGSCSECASWFRVEAGGSRSDKRYCTDACRQRAYRKRKGTA